MHRDNSDPSTMYACIQNSMLQSWLKIKFCQGRLPFDESRPEPVRRNPKCDICLVHPEHAEIYPV